MFGVVDVLVPYEVVVPEDEQAGRSSDLQGSHVTLTVLISNLRDIYIRIKYLD